MRAVDKTKAQTKMSPPKTVLAAVVGLLGLFLIQPGAGEPQQLILPVLTSEWPAAADLSSASQSRAMKEPGHLGDSWMYAKPAPDSYGSIQSQMRSMHMPVPFYNSPVALSQMQHPQYLQIPSTGYWAQTARSMGPMQARQFNPIEAYLRDQAANSRHQDNQQGSSSRALGDTLASLPVTIESGLNPSLDFNNQRVPVAAYYKQVESPESLWNWSRNQGHGLRTFF